jgi:hypothetical protein
MTNQTEWLELLEAIEFVGPLMFPEWTGYERRAPTYRELSADIARLHELTPKQLVRAYVAWRAGIKAEAERERAARQSVEAKPSGIRAGLEKLRSQLAVETNEARRHALERAIESLSRELARSDERSKSQSEMARDCREFVIGVLAERIEAEYRPGLAARQRWHEAHAAIDDEGRAGRIRARAYLPGLPPLPVSAAKWPEIFPPPGERRAVIDGIPARIFLAKADLETAFTPDRSSSDPLDRGGPGRPSMRHLLMREMERRAERRRDHARLGRPGVRKPGI